MVVGGDIWPSPSCAAEPPCGWRWVPPAGSWSTPKGWVSPLPPQPLPCPTHSPLPSQPLTVSLSVYLNDGFHFRHLLPSCWCRSQTQRCWRCPLERSDNDVKVKVRSYLVSRPTLMRQTPGPDQWNTTCLLWEAFSHTAVNMRILVIHKCETSTSIYSQVLIHTVDLIGATQRAQRFNNAIYDMNVCWYVLMMMELWDSHTCGIYRQEMYMHWPIVCSNSSSDSVGWHFSFCFRLKRCQSDL